MTLIDVALPEQFVLHTEFSLRRLPQRIDLLIIRREAPSPASFPFLPALLSQLTDITLLEFKGGTDAVQAEDPGIVLGSAAPDQSPCVEPVLLLADRSTPYGTLFPVLQAASNAGFAEIRLVVASF